MKIKILLKPFKGHYYDINIIKMTEVIQYGDDTIIINWSNL